MKSFRSTTFISFSLTTSLLGSGCVVDDDGAGLDATVEEGGESFDDGAEDDVDFRTYEGVIANPWLGSPVRTGTTVGKTNEFTPTCAPSLSPDVSYTWTAPASATYVFTTTGSSFDTVLHVRSFTNSAQTLACNNNASMGTQQSSVTLDLLAGTTVIIVIDGVKNKSGNFQLNITNPNPCPGGCNSPPTQCHEDSGPCLVDPATGVGSCYYGPKPTGSDCVGDNWCATGWHCANYSCVPDAFRTCSIPPNDCYEEGWGQCDWLLEACVHTPKPAGTPCDDGDPCTSGTVCTGTGSCLGIDTCPDPSDPGPDPIDPVPEDPCSAWGNLEDCGGGSCCVVGSNCQICA